MTVRVQVMENDNTSVACMELVELLSLGVVYLKNYTSRVNINFAAIN